MPVVVAEAVLAGPAPRVGVTVTGLGVGESVVSLWRVADGERNAVRGARREVMNDASYVDDWDAPLGRPVSYELEVITGPGGSSRTASNTVSLDSTTGWIMDPLVPQSAVPINRRMLPSGEAVFEVSAMAAFDHVADVQVYQILGSNKPMALFGQRMAAAGVDLSMVTNAAEENSRMKALLASTGQVLVRVPASWTAALPGSFFGAVGTVTERPVGARIGSPLTIWSLVADSVAAPSIRVLTATFSYGDVEILMGTYQQKQDLMAGKTYLDDLKNPIGG